MPRAQKKIKVTGEGDGLPEYKHCQGREACIYRLQYRSSYQLSYQFLLGGKKAFCKIFINFYNLFENVIRSTSAYSLLGRLMFRMQSYMSYHTWLPGTLLLEQPLIFVWHLFLMPSQSAHFAPLYLGVSSRLGS